VQPADQRAHEVFDATLANIPAARHWATRQLRTWGFEDLVNDLELAVGELVTNAVCHGEGPVDVVLAVLGDRLRVEAHDRGGGHPAIRAPATAGPDIGGWGLRLVSQVADAWDAQVTDSLTIVWAERNLASPRRLPPTPR